MSEEFNCSTCHNHFELNTVKHCKICSSEVCDYCFDECSLLEIEDGWLEELPNTCDRCHRVGCENCLSTCYQCWNIDETYDILCRDCSDLSKQKSRCEKHSHWDFCEKHLKNECPACLEKRSYRHWGLEISK